ncbi:hypothetical protein FC70_GL000193 [Paucilactobacillus oligofermentans DSM 15707 = LMG 22743]|uniref:Tyr recombinase domain-containing protein n=1 Tax=Paucilactobacillus oligofermentans DSM 15707 = LMG 22743 TaxID=1423778 RepID=A0A0R1RX71_9LACO|nr:site-specific integrase [Paucilactobacillus oligofermentans]KRL57723.1 hypothetical protein FC70_GL000193 [Paucilactobacillus oligofermentans DSM 15707 = LMG 22743]CUS26831.1 Phage integrase [Paucilactobacillus oligofermentans DSM 15707 = LMG 22743]
MKIESYKYKNGNKYYKVQAYLGTDPLTNRRLRTTRRGFKTAKEARQAGNKLELAGKTAIKNTKTFNTVYEEWFLLYKTTVRESTYVKNHEVFELHVLPLLGKLKITNITPEICQSLINKWFESGLTRYKRFKNELSRVFKYAVQLKIIQDNPIDRIIIPRNTNIKKKTARDNYYTLEQLKEFFDCVREMYNPKMFIFFFLVANTGMRKGEALALKWTDINFKNKTLSVNKTLTQGINNRLYTNRPKTDSSDRQIPIGDHLIEELKKWKKIQLEELLIFGKNAINIDQLVFSNAENTFLQPSKPLTWIYSVVKKYNLKHINVHGLRHTFTGIAQQGGLSAKETGTILGHSSIVTTEDIYHTLSPDEVKNAGARFEKFASL